MKRTLILLLAFPVATACAFTALTALTLVEFSKQGEKPEPRAEEPKTHLAARYKEQTEALVRKRRKQLQKVTFESFLNALNSKGGRIPQALLLARFRALVRKDPEASGRLLSLLLPSLRAGKPSRAKEAVLTQSCLIAPATFRLGPAQRKGLYSFVEKRPGEPLSRALLLLVGQVGEARDLTALGALAEKLQGEPIYKRIVLAGASIKERTQSVEKETPGTRSSP